MLIWLVKISLWVVGIMQFWGIIQTIFDSNSSFKDYGWWLIVLSISTFCTFLVAYNFSPFFQCFIIKKKVADE